MLRALFDDDESGAGELYALVDALQQGGCHFSEGGNCWETAEGWD